MAIILTRHHYKAIKLYNIVWRGMAIKRNWMNRKIGMMKEHEYGMK